MEQSRAFVFVSHVDRPLWWGHQNTPAKYLVYIGARWRGAFGGYQKRIVFEERLLTRVQPLTWYLRKCIVSILAPILPTPI